MLNDDNELNLRQQTIWKFYTILDGVDGDILQVGYHTNIFKFYSHK